MPAVPAAAAAELADSSEMSCEGLLPSRLLASPALLLSCCCSAAACAWASRLALMLMPPEPKELRLPARPPYAAPAPPAWPPW